MKVTMNKGIFKVIIGLIILIIIVVGGIFLVPITKTNTDIKKFSEINAKEFEEQIIENLKSSALNLDNATYKTEFRKLNAENSKFEKNIKISYETADLYNTEILEKKADEHLYEDFISAFIINTNNDSLGVAIPCFKISSDNNGNLKSIEFVDTVYDDFNFIGRIIEYEIENVLNTKYGIDTKIISELRYKNNSKINIVSNEDKIKIIYNDNDFMIDTFKTISNNMGNDYGAYSFKVEELNNVKVQDIIGEYKYDINFNTLVLTINESNK